MFPKYRIDYKIADFGGYRYFVQKRFWFFFYEDIEEHDCYGTAEAAMDTLIIKETNE